MVPDAEHDEYAWWPAEVERWPAEADEPLRALATMLARARDHLQPPRARLVLPLAGLPGAADRRLRPATTRSRRRSSSASRTACCGSACRSSAWSAVRLRIIPLRIAVAVAVLGGIGPFFGSAEFIREQRRRARAAVACRRGRIALAPRARVRDDGRRNDDAGRDAQDGRLGDRGNGPRMAQGRGRSRRPPRRRSSRSRPTRSTPRSPRRSRARSCGSTPPRARRSAVGALLAEIAANGDAPRARRRATSPPASRPAARRRRRRPRRRRQAIVDIVTPAAGESVTEGTILGWTVAVGDRVARRRHGRRDLDRQGRRRAAAPAAGTIAELLVAAEGDTVTVGQVIGRMRRPARAAGRTRRRPAGAPAADGPRAAAAAGAARRHAGARLAGRAPRRRRARASTSARVAGSGPPGGSSRPTCSRPPRSASRAAAPPARRRRC